MIVGLGIDGVEISRFASWPNYEFRRLRQVFSAQEITYALSVPIKAPERFAARFAAKEAAYKALVQLMPNPVPLLVFCTFVSVVNSPTGAPSLIVDFTELQIDPRLKISISLSHTESLALAVVIVERQGGA